MTDKVLVNIIVKVQGLIPEIRWSQVRWLSNNKEAIFRESSALIPNDLRVNRYSIEGVSILGASERDSGTTIILECEYI